MLVDDMWRAIIEIRELHREVHTILAAVVAGQATIIQEIKAMSETISQQIDAATASIQTDVSDLATVIG